MAECPKCGRPSAEPVPCPACKVQGKEKWSKFWKAAAPVLSAVVSVIVVIATRGKVKPKA